MLENRARRVSKAKPADEHVKIGISQQGQSHVRERDLRLPEGAGHEVFLPELDLEHLAYPGILAPAEAEGAERCRPVIKFWNPTAVPIIGARIAR